MNISVIIPTFNEEDVIQKTIQTVFSRGGDELLEIIVADGGSSDGTADNVRSSGARLIFSEKKGRAAQMNAGASEGRGEILYFLHADSQPPENFDRKIISAVKNKASAGCFRLVFDHPHPLLKMFAWFTRFDLDLFRFGDQSLFVEKSEFEKAGGFRENHIVMEDQEIVTRIKKRAPFIVLPDSVTTSARKYLDVGVVKLQFIFVVIFTLYYAGVKQETLKSMYKELLNLP